ncbi:MAG: hypothetical protein H0X03_05795 [Nitrosopumilus sp.]|nr:hypothetical protein [Nitrosopumilus sp.]
MLKCKHCNSDFFTGIDVEDVQAFMNMSFENNTHKCDKCDQNAIYNTPDYYLVK